MTASPSKPYEDCIGGGVNDFFAGFPGADTDIYGNIIRYCADDAIEADGGGMNVRIWGNYIDGTRTPFSFSPLSLGPTYLFRNVIDRGSYGVIDNNQSSNIVKTQSAGSYRLQRAALRLPQHLAEPGQQRLQLGLPHLDHDPELHPVQQQCLGDPGGLHARQRHQSRPRFRAVLLVRL